MSLQADRRGFLSPIAWRAARFEWIRRIGFRFEERRARLREGVHPFDREYGVDTSGHLRASKHLQNLRALPRRTPRSSPGTFRSGRRFASSPVTRSIPRYCPAGTWRYTSTTPSARASSKDVCRTSNTRSRRKRGPFTSSTTTRCGLQSLTSPRCRWHQLG